MGKKNILKDSTVTGRASVIVIRDKRVILRETAISWNAKNKTIETIEKHLIIHSIALALKVVYFLSVVDKIILFHAKIKQKSRITAESPVQGDTAESVHSQAVSIRKTDFKPLDLSLLQFITATTMPLALNFLSK